ncbi:MAG: hypothetical protein WB799_14365 [Candidatus Sulfotelmatobacter sp.]
MTRKPELSSEPDQADDHPEYAEAGIGTKAKTIASEKQRKRVGQEPESVWSISAGVSPEADQV